MPNWCLDELYIRGTKSDIEELLQTVDGGTVFHEGEQFAQPFDFNKIIPYPAHFAAADKAAEEFGGEDGYNHGGYEWCIEKWGTKWNAVSVYIDNFEAEEVDRGVRCIRFQTAWAPPIPVIAAASKQFPALNFTLYYGDPLACFRGTFVAENGRVLVDECSEDWDALEVEETPAIVEIAVKPVNLEKRIHGT